MKTKPLFFLMVHSRALVILSYLSSFGRNHESWLLRLQTLIITNFKQRKKKKKTVCPFNLSIWVSIIFKWRNTYELKWTSKLCSEWTWIHNAFWTVSWNWSIDFAALHSKNWWNIIKTFSMTISPDLIAGPVSFYLKIFRYKPIAKRYEEDSRVP